MEMRRWVHDDSPGPAPGRTVTPDEAVAGDALFLYRVAEQTGSFAERILTTEADRHVEVKSTRDRWVGGGGEGYRWRMAFERVPTERLVGLMRRFATVVREYAGVHSRCRDEMDAATTMLRQLGLGGALTGFTRLTSPDGFHDGFVVELDQNLIRQHLAAHPTVPPDQVRELIQRATNAFTRLEEHRDMLARELARLREECDTLPRHTTRLGPSASDAASEALLRRYAAGDGTRELAGEPGSALSEHVKTQPPVLAAVYTLVSQQAASGVVEGSATVTAGADAPLSQQLLFGDPSAHVRAEATTTVLPLSDGRRQVTVDGTYTLVGDVDAARVAAGRVVAGDLPGTAYPLRVTWTGRAVFEYGPNGQLLSSSGYP